MQSPYRAAGCWKRSLENHNYVNDDIIVMVIIIISMIMMMVMTSRKYEGAVF